MEIRSCWQHLYFSGTYLTKIYQVVQYWPEDCFKNFGEEVSQTWRDGDADPELGHYCRYNEAAGE